MGEAMVDIEWRISDAPVPYPAAVAAMEERVAAIRAGSAPELVWLLEHPPLYTAGTSATDGDLVDPQLFPVYRSGRGGQYTYHGPGQRVGYVMLDLQRRGVALNVDPDLSHYRGIIPCGVREHGVTSLAERGIVAAMPEVDAAMKRAFAAVFAERHA